MDVEKAEKNQAEESAAAAKVKEWLEETVRRGPLACDANALNHVTAAVPTLIADLDRADGNSPDLIARKWFAHHIPGSAASLTLELWHHMVDALEALAEKLEPYPKKES